MRWKKGDIFYSGCLSYPNMIKTYKGEIELCGCSNTPLGIADHRSLLIYYVHINMFSFKFNWYGEALNFCVKYNLSFDRIQKREDWWVRII